jgi:hypothetical protein
MAGIGSELSQPVAHRVQQSERPNATPTISNVLLHIHVKPTASISFGCIFHVITTFASHGRKKERKREEGV